MTEKLNKKMAEQYRIDSESKRLRQILSDTDGIKSVESKKNIAEILNAVKTIFGAIKKCGEQKVDTSKLYTATLSLMLLPVSDEDKLDVMIEAISISQANEISQFGKKGLPAMRCMKKSDGKLAYIG
jgi:protein subunit release factor A